MSGARRRALQRIILQLEELKGHLEDILAADALQADLPEDGAGREPASAAWGGLFGAWDGPDAVADSAEDGVE